MEIMDQVTAEAKLEEELLKSVGSAGVNAVSANITTTKGEDAVSVLIGNNGSGDSEIFLNGESAGIVPVVDIPELAEIIISWYFEEDGSGITDITSFQNVEDKA